jgi:hypothetical protein
MAKVLLEIPSVSTDDKTSTVSLTFKLPNIGQSTASEISLGFDVEVADRPSDFSKVQDRDFAHPDCGSYTFEAFEPVKPASDVTQTYDVHVTADQLKELLAARQVILIGGCYLYSSLGTSIIEPFCRDLIVNPPDSWRVYDCKLD